MPAASATTAEAGNPPFRIRGALTITRAASIQREIDAEPDPLVIDLSGVERMDTVGAWLVYRAVRDRGAKVVGASPESQSLLDQVAEFDKPAQVRPEERQSFVRMVSEIGEWIAESGRTLVGLLGFFGATLVGIANVISHPKRFRLNAVVQRFDVVGVRALGIIGLMSFLIGIVIAQQGAVQLQQFGAEIYTINLIGRITVRELGTLMTAIMVAGRSGSAFAAQLGTMNTNQEIDALSTMGISPMEFLVLPRMLALIMMMPLLTIYADLVGILGGAAVGMAMLGLGSAEYFEQTRGAVSLTSFFIGICKSLVFGVVVALVGCFRGMQSGRSAAAVGLATTSAVVTSIVLIIVIDGIFAVVLNVLGL